MGQTLTHGIYLPDEGERNCYNGLAANWNILDGAVGTVAEHTSALAGKAPLVHTHSKSDITDLLNSNFIPSANNSYNLGSSTYQWNNLYANNYFYNGVAWGLNVKNVWTHYNVINGYRFEIKQTSQEIGVLPSSNQWNGFNFVDKNEQNTISFQHAFLPAETRFTISMVDNVASHNSDSTVLIEFLKLTAYEGGSGFCVGSDLRPLRNNLNLGISTNKWKTLNGVNPGALSLPSDSSSVSIDTTNWNVSGGLGNSYTPTSNGWLHINIKDSATNSIFVYASNKYAASIYGNGSQGLDGRLALMIPVLSGVAYGIIIKAGSVSEIYTAKFIPCQGNV